MQIFELHFNPGINEDQFFDSFVYEPENIYEKKLGSLYIVGELQNALPQNSKFLDNLAGNIKKNYYILSFKSPETALSASLKKANEFLAEEVRKENVSWLGNLNFAIFSLRDFTLSFTKTGDLKILLIREGQIIDIGKNLDLQEIDPYPLKIFFNIVSGKLSQNDMILVLTKKIFEFFRQENLLDKIAQVNSLDEKKIKEIFPSRLFDKGEGSKISGICFLAVLKESLEAEKEAFFSRDLNREAKKIRFQKEKKFSFFQILSPVSNLFRKTSHRLPSFKKSTKFLNKFGKTLKTSLLKTSFKKKLAKKPKIEIPKSQILEKVILKKQIIKNLIKTSFPKKNLILISLLVFFLFLGFLIFKGGELKKENDIKKSLSEIEKKVHQAENFLIFKNEEKAKSLLKEAWSNILLLSKEENSLKPDVLSLKQSIEKNLWNLNKLESIETPELLFEVKPKEWGFVPQKILFSGSNIYLYSPLSSNLYEFNLKENKGTTLKINGNPKLATSFSETPLFFQAPNILLFLKNENWQEEILQVPEPDSGFTELSSYASNLYFLNGKKYEIIKYPFLKTLKWGKPQTWLKNKASQKTSAKSMAIDGSIWILNRDNSIDLYYLGNYQKTIILDIFPSLENITKIKTRPGLPYLYLLEPVKKRIIVIDKTGKIIRQFQSERFNNLKDFAVPAKGKVIYLLNGLKIYQIKL